MRVLSLVSLLSWAVAFAPMSTTIGSRRIFFAANDDDKMIVESVEDTERRNLVINVVTGGLLVASGVASWDLYKQVLYTPSGFQRLPTTQFIAALGDPKASEGSGAQSWGLWREDPGPRGVFFWEFDKELGDGVAPRGWKFDPKDWWLEEHGACCC